jgi:hypothetical protein
MDAAEAPESMDGLFGAERIRYFAIIKQNEINFSFPISSLIIVRIHRIAVILNTNYHDSLNRWQVRFN